MATIKQLKTKTWTEIKLRNPSQTTCREIETMMTDLRELSASKALERYINKYSSNKGYQDQLWNTQQELLHDLEKKDQVIDIYKEKLRRLTASYHDFLFELNTDIDLEDKKPQTKIR